MSMPESRHCRHDARPRSGRLLFVVGFVLSWLTVGATEVQAQGLFDWLFGGPRRPPASAPVPPGSVPNVRTWGDTGTTTQIDPATGLAITVTPRTGLPNGGTIVYCVRTCDGYFFPLANAAASSDAQRSLCRSLCPGAPTEVYTLNTSQGGMEKATTRSGRTYRALSTAFDFREGYRSTCSCRPAGTGLTYLPIQEDVTLKSGDIVVTARGLRVFGGGNVPFRDSNFSSWRGGSDGDFGQRLAAIDRFYRSEGRDVSGSTANASDALRLRGSRPAEAQRNAQLLRVWRVPPSPVTAIVAAAPTADGVREIRQIMPLPLTTGTEAAGAPLDSDAPSFLDLPAPPWARSPVAPPAQQSEATGRESAAN
jgi:hypothetical protein